MSFYGDFPVHLADETLALPGWRLVGADNQPKVEADLSTFTYTLYRLGAGTSVGITDRNALAGNNGVTISTGMVYHDVEADDNALSDADTAEHRRVIYTMTFTDETVQYRQVDYLLRPRGH